MAKSTDLYANTIRGSATEASAGDGASVPIDFGLGLMDRVALKLIRLETTLMEKAALLLDTADAAFCGLASVPAVAGSEIATISDPRVICQQMIEKRDFGTPASATILSGPMVLDYSTLPEGGLLVPARPLYWHVFGRSLAVSLNVRFVMYFTMMSVSDADYIEMLQSRGVFGGGTA